MGERARMKEEGKRRKNLLADLPGAGNDLSAGTCQAGKTGVAAQALAPMQVHAFLSGFDFSHIHLYATGAATAVPLQIPSPYPGNCYLAAMASP